MPARVRSPNRSARSLVQETGGLTRGTLLATLLAVFAAQVGGVPVASLLGEISTSLEISGSQLTWITAAYGVPTAVLTLSYGLIGDLFGHKKVLLAGTVLVSSEFMALHAIAVHFGRPGTSTDQAWIETFFGHLKTEFPHLTRITEPRTSTPAAASRSARTARPASNAAHQARLAHHRAPWPD